MHRTSVALYGEGKCQSNLVCDDGIQSPGTDDEQSGRQSRRLLWDRTTVCDGFTEYLDGRIDCLTQFQLWSNNETVSRDLRNAVRGFETTQNYQIWIGGPSK